MSNVINLTILQTHLLNLLKTWLRIHQIRCQTLMWGTTIIIKKRASRPFNWVYVD
jgi:hypothetical protein